MNESKSSYWRALSDEWLQSKESQKKFCERKGVNYSHFVYWRSQFLQEAGKSRRQFKPVKLDKPAAGHGLLQMVLPNGIRIQIDGELNAANLKLIIDCAKQS